MAKIVAGVCTSHVPAIGAAIDLGKTQEPYWTRVFSGFEESKRWIEEVKPLAPPASAARQLFAL